MRIFLLDCWYFNFSSVRPGLSNVAGWLNLTLCLSLWIKFTGTQLYLLKFLYCAWLLACCEWQSWVCWRLFSSHVKNTCSLWPFKKGSVDPWFNVFFSRVPLCLSHAPHRFSSFIYLWFILHIFFWTVFQLIHSIFRYAYSVLFFPIAMIISNTTFYSARISIWFFLYSF